MMVVFAACAPETIGAYIWQRVPTLRCMLEMLLTGQWRFPALERFSYRRAGGKEVTEDTIRQIALADGLVEQAVDDRRLAGW